MKTKQICACLACILLALLLAACGKHNELLYAVADGERTVSVLGSDSRVWYLSVSEGGKEIWSKRIYADKTIGARNGTYGFRLMDVNFDGKNDLVVAITAEGDVTTEQVYLQTSGGSYELSTALEGKCNLAIDARQELVFAFQHTDRIEQDASVAKTYHVITDRSTAYSWQGNTLVPRRYVSLTYYGGSDRYCYSVADYDAKTGTWEDSDDRWMTPAEYATQTFDGLYYFKDTES